MLTYQIRPRIFRLQQASALRFPADCHVEFSFEPKQPFGEDPGGGRTAVRNTQGKLHFNLDTGSYQFISKPPLAPLDVHINEGGTRTIRLLGSKLTVSQHCADLEELHALVAIVYFTLPMLLNVKFADPPVVRRVSGRIGEVPFRWQLSKWSMPVSLTTQEQQELGFAEAWNDLDLFSIVERRRLLGSLHYFHVAVRLVRCGSTPGEFLAEVLLNLSKTLETLFPPGTRDAVREGLASLGYDTRQIEQAFVPAMALRNELGVGHVSLASFTQEQLRTVHAYTENIEDHFRELLKRVLKGVREGTFDIAPYTNDVPSERALRVIDRLREAFPPEAT